MDFVSIVILITLIIVIINTIYSTVYKVVNMPSAPQTRKAIINDIRLHQGIDNHLNIYDLGSGWGGLCRKLASSFPKASIIGYEISPIPFIISKIKWRKNYAIKRANIFKINITNADIIICYLSPTHMKQLERDIQARAKKGAVFYSQGFPFPTIQPEKVIEIPYSLERKLYKYQF